MDRVRRRALAALAVLGCASCSQADGFLDAQIDHQLRQDDPPTLDLTLVGPAQWTRVCVFGPCATDALARERLGFDWDVERLTSLARDDGKVALVFSDGRRVLAFVERARAAADFTTVSPACRGRDAARLVGWREASGRLRFDAPRGAATADRPEGAAGSAAVTPAPGGARRP